MEKSSSQNDSAVIGRIFQFKIILDGIKPPIWRRIQVSERITLHTLHIVIQNVMGWEDRHLYEFNHEGARFTAIEVDSEEESLAANTESIRLKDLHLKKGATISYVYDFGDYWSHEIILEEFPSIDPAQAYPVCISGARACPPEDCGGLPGYEELLEALSHPKHPEHEEMKRRLHRKFNPELFETEKVNQELRNEFTPGV
ncbi:MAG: plasmid pRiA4b ORF-3 family protein [Candidatus Eisenbacteria bacterium]|nr:plasmid pRiA4b ORF-3 family protein [Candidatus Eisenbacteria bacterium]MBU1948570.1 plasmid pRiA4b ORF-3 family protein [Candidatus Eisenbacteria bacterium]